MISLNLCEKIETVMLIWSCGSNTESLSPNSIDYNFLDEEHFLNVIIVSNFPSSSGIVSKSLNFV